MPDNDTGGIFEESVPVVAAACERTAFFFERGRQFVETVLDARTPSILRSVDSDGD